MNSTNGQQQVQDINANRAASLVLLSRLIPEVCDLFEDLWIDWQGENPEQQLAWYSSENNTVLSGCIFVQPVIGAGKKPIAWILGDWVMEEGKEPGWMFYTITREFRTSHILYVRGSSDFTAAMPHKVESTINFLKWIKTRLTTAKESVQPIPAQS